MVYRISLSVVIGVLLSACAGTLAPREVVYWPAIRGQVLEDGTEQPIPGAMLVARWSGVGAYSHSECFHVEAATSDAQGNYVIPAWTNHDDSNRLTYQSVQLTVYAPGYIRVRSSGPFTNEETYNTYKNFTDWIEGAARTVKYLRKDTGTVRERLDYLRDEIVGCGDRYVENAKLLAFYTAIRDEVSNIPEAEGQAKIKIWVQNHIDKIEIGFDAAEKLYIERLKSLERTER